MKYFLTILLSMGSFLNAQTLELADLFSYKFYPQGVYGGSDMADGEHFTLLSENGIDLYSYKDFEKVKTLVSGSFTDYEFNKNEKWLLLQQESEAIFRRSQKAKYTLQNMESGEKFLLFDGKKIQEPTLSPDGKKIAFVFENNIYIQNIEDKKTMQVTFDGKTNEIINGITDWVYEEEFAFVRAFDWNADSDKIAYIRFDESDVPVMDIDVYQQNLYPTELRFKYPKAGEQNSEVSVHIFNLIKKTTQKVDLGRFNKYGGATVTEPTKEGSSKKTSTYDYVPKIQFTNKSNKLAVIVSNRQQNELTFYMVNAENLETKKIFTETDKAWIDTDNLTLEFLADNSFIWNSERDGFRQLYHYADNGKVLNQITKGNWEITSFYGYDSQNKRLYFQSTEQGSINRAIYSISLDGKNKKLLSPKIGINNGQFNGKYNYFILSHKKANQVPVYSLVSAQSGKVEKVLKDNKSVQQRWDKYQINPQNFEEIEINGNLLNAYTIKPKDFDPNKKYPLFMYLYGGPGSQEVLNESSPFYYWWFQYLASQGYMIACVDNRGTGGKGAAFKKATYKQLGKLEIEDQIAAAQYFGSLEYVDADRIGIFGWSFGGYMTSLALTKGADVFKMGIAVAPVTNWRFYDTVYTERFLQTPQENPNGYDDNSPINFVNLMKGNFLLIHGTADDNVHVQNSMRFAEALIQADKDFEYMVYPDKNHGIYGGNTRRHLFKKMTKFIQENL